MCGVFGVVTRSSAEPSSSLVESSLNTLHHRGPDDSGTHIGPGVGLAHTRLSLLDLHSRSAQPFWDTTNRHCLVYNGEIYNYLEIRGQLEREGVRFRTTGDTEVVLEAILRWGPDKALKQFEGMFALAIWDTRDRHLLMARDRFGIKPLFVFSQSEKLIFSSEIQAFAPWMEWRPRMSTVIAYLMGSGGPFTGPTFVDGIDFVPPGTITEWSDGDVIQRRFATISDAIDPDESGRLAAMSADEALKEVELALSRSVRAQLIADSRVGMFCSGGVDSSLLLALARKDHSDLAVFHAEVVGPTSERDAAEELARHLQLELHSVAVTDQDFLDLLPKLSVHHGSPFFLNPHAVPFYAVSCLVRDSGVKAVLSGEGADELYLGYPWLVPGRVQRRGTRETHNPSRSIGSGTGRFVAGLLERLGTELDRDENMKNVVDRSRLASLDLLQANLRGLLHRNDAMGMAASIESRFPYLDERFVALSLNLPSRLKVQRGINVRNRQHPFAIDKWALRRIADKYLPRALSRRRKVPFATTAYGRLRVSPKFFADGFVPSVLELGAAESEYMGNTADRRLLAKLVHLEVWGRALIWSQGEDELLDAVHAGVAVTPHIE